MKEFQDRIRHGSAPNPTSTRARISVRLTLPLTGWGEQREPRAGGAGCSAGCSGRLPGRIPLSTQDLVDAYIPAPPLCLSVPPNRLYPAQTGLL